MVRALHIVKIVVRNEMRLPESGFLTAQWPDAPSKIEGLGRRAPGAGMQGAGGRPFAPTISTPVSQT